MPLSKNITPKKSLGQNFLNDSNIAQKIIDSLDIQDDDHLIEIGPGTGALTQFLFDKKIKYTGIEIDQRSADLLKEKIEESELSNFEILNLDFKKVKLNELINTKVKIFGNLPYYITSPIIFKVFEEYKVVESATFMVQKEVAERIVANPGKKDNGILAIASRLYSDPKKIFDVSPTCFYPVPKVWSSVVKFDFHQKYSNQKEIMVLVKKSFNQRRKMLSNTLKEEFRESNSKFIDEKKSLRPEVLSVEDFVELYKQINL